MVGRVISKMRMQGGRKIKKMTILKLSTIDPCDDMLTTYLPRNLLDVPSSRAKGSEDPIVIIYLGSTM